MGKKKEQPSFAEQTITTRNAEIQAREVADIDYGNLVKLREFSQMVLEDGKYQIYFSPYLEDGNGNLVVNPKYSEAYAPLELMFSRLLRLGNMTPKEVLMFKRALHGTVQQARVLAKTKLEHFIINSMEKYIGWTVTIHSRNGNTLKALTENKKTLSLISGNLKKKKGWFGF